MDKKRIGQIVTKESPVGGRVIAAYYRAGGDRHPLTPVMQHAVPTLNGEPPRIYVPLIDQQGLIAMYRYSEKLDRIWRMNRWNKAITELALKAHAEKVAA